MCSAKYDEENESPLAIEAKTKDTLDEVVGTAAYCRKG